MKRTKLSISLPSEVVKWIRVKARESGLTVSGFIALVLSHEKRRP